MNHSNPKQQELNQLIQEFQEEYGTCLDWIFQELNEPENLGYSEDLMDLFKKYSPNLFSPQITPIIRVNYRYNQVFDKDAKRIKKYVYRMRIRKLALENLPYYVTYDFLGAFRQNMNPFIHYARLMEFYFWLERLYIISIGKKLGFEDVLNVYFSGLFERIIIGLDKFNELTETPEINREFFQKLSNVTGIDNEAKTFKIRSMQIIELAIKKSPKFSGYIKFPYRPKYDGLKYSEEGLLNLLATFSAANGNRDKIIAIDYVNAYKVYYNLLKTDISKYKCQEELFNDKCHGYLVCQSCGNYYELRRGETPKDFTNCYCGGKIKYLKYLNDDRQIKWKSVAINTTILTIILLSTFNYISIIYFIILVPYFYLPFEGISAIILEPEKSGIILGFAIVITASFSLSTLILYLYFPAFNEMSKSIYLGMIIFFISITIIYLSIKTMKKIN